ncbi:uncharacterized protein FOMMEDRAFT_167188 [Fomitiporia mediterranea MF3/22]|uniref:uncharacterized protein n=1 Tax=Fomitiporia mediterranea (strain MF3/22) TaxID=694068 RepID=UPI00044096B1|nr:uncharacterized protein FOMMEDRAFT_167188 [Fomitiporia mediterranea MF3/22]EJD03880.1 hypothetical protein FOMMEDRAFT_167188 [Fomitiporia mediterranea MF3/22]
MADVTPSSAAEPLYQVRLLAALRNGDAALIHQLLSEIGKDKRKGASDDFDIGAAALHLAIRCASTDTIALLLSNRSISPNAVYPHGSGTTALHLAASIGRADVVNLLLEQEGIDDTLRDAHGRTCKDVARGVARGKEVHKVINDSRSLLTATYRSRLHSYIASPQNQGPPQDLVDLLHSPRVRLVDLSYLDPSTGRSLLHEAALRKDLSLIDLSIKAGADVFVRDRRGKSVVESVSGSKDDKVRVFLRQFTNHDASLLDQATTSTEPPTLKGYLSKYTNVAKGYNTRWFVLKNGVLSYYRHQDDEHVASRGSIAMKSATLVHPGADKLRFEVHSTPGRGQQRWYLKGSHAVEVGRWIQAIARSIELTRRDGGSIQTQSGSESETRSLRQLGANIRTSISSRKVNKASTPSINSSLDEKSNANLVESDERVEGVVEDEERKDEDDQNEDDSSDARSQLTPPHEAEFTLQGNATAAQVELTAQLSTSLVLPADAPVALREVRVALEDSAQAASRMVGDFVRMAAEREDWWREKLARERARGTLWEESLQVVVKEGAALEEELKSRSRARRRSSRISEDRSGRTSLEITRSTLRMRGSLTSGMFSPPAFRLDQPPSSRAVSGLPSPSESGVPERGEIHAEPAPITLPPSLQEDVEDLVSTDEEDEFFDAIESNQLPNVVVPDALVKPTPMGTGLLIKLDQFGSYQHLRDRLPIEKDTRPPTSLWSVLKHSIGKDLTKISFPVFFNEPTSMLQRMAEDMEFSECLDAAVAESDPQKRIAFVAAFAMSNYSSTIGRIAKPFNPMLSETFEYVRIDKKYRYVSEQVSHHPPVSACWAESPNWHYFGEVDAQNKFMGKSFEIRPTGVAHAELLIPEKLGTPDYPKAKGPLGQGKVVEHYSWKKVTTNVSGFIMGSPTIDHYGDMTVVNHRTGDTCILTFKPRGWRGKDAFEILGRVMDAEGNVTYEIAGRWNSQLVARAVGAGYGVLHPDVSIQSPASPSTQEFILLWRNSEKPPAPFNLTPFAITLNDLPNDLKPVLCPTDCRLRPDQRAFELGKYERANELKGLQEDFQRATRRAREEGRAAPHKPRWFEAKTESDTGERVWEPYRASSGEVAYWKEREDVWRAYGPWKYVERIFIEDET